MSSENLAAIRTVRIRGAHVRVSVRGLTNGEPLLLIMGIGASLELWRDFESQMVSRGFRVITFDLPGAGATPAVFPPRRMRGLARIAVGVLDDLQIDRAHVLGISFGGFVAQEFARRAPTRLHRLVLAATGPGIGGPPGKPSALVHMLTPLRYWSPSYASRVASNLYGGRARLDPAREGSLVAGFQRPPSWWGYFGQLCAVVGWSSVPWLRKLEARTLVITGGDDPIARPVNGRILASLIPQAQLRVIDGAGHLFLLDESHAAAALVEDFLRDA
ncbi:alpha/beta fold hydrolase [Nocardioides pocheonensis]|uniref:Alpha/beta fold hydrolase n=1 Tax=Nocardioides pocheonensis TaxID=661485 RepID=A0A3N0GJP1_9ACTN|nr:alpha/beta hydrolase [Nocardioides pocheonensis]RNM12631.1 alpha/beta fold hydrolase [Nocardioides pocheonensis]